MHETDKPSYERAKLPGWARGHDASIAYHGKLLADPERMAAYDRAIRALVRPGDVVLDVGCGTGVLAMLAAKAGAAHVHAVESMPVAKLARQLVARNGLAGTVTVHHADILQMQPVQQVDIVISEFMGRFVVDDGMLPAVAASAQWLKPGGTFCPAKVTLSLAPAHMTAFTPLDVFETPVTGLDVSAAADDAHNYTYSVDLPDHALLSAPQQLHTFTPPAVLSAVEGQLELEIMRPGRLRGLAGWFEATLAPGIALCTAPGNMTHWGQILLPLPAIAVRPGDRVEVTVTLQEGTRIGWHWRGCVRRSGDDLVAFDLNALGRDRDMQAAEPRRPLSEAAIAQLDEAGAKAAHDGDLQTAARCFEEAVLGLHQAQDSAARRLHANLGAVYTLMGRHRAAVGPLLRALDGDAASDPQTARLLVDALFKGHMTALGAQWLARYEQAHGPHPAGWHSTDDRDTP